MIVTDEPILLAFRTIDNACKNKDSTAEILNILFGLYLNSKIDTPLHFAVDNEGKVIIIEAL